MIKLMPKIIIQGATLELDAASLGSLAECHPRLLEAADGRPELVAALDPVVGLLAAIVNLVNGTFIVQEPIRPGPAIPAPVPELPPANGSGPRPTATPSDDQSLDPDELRRLVEDRTFTLKQVAEQLHMSEPNLYRLMRQHNIRRTTRTGGLHIDPNPTIWKSDLDRPSPGVAATPGSSTS